MPGQCMGCKVTIQARTAVLVLAAFLAANATMIFFQTPIHGSMCTCLSTNCAYEPWFFQTVTAAHDPKVCQVAAEQHIAAVPTAW